MSKKKDLVLKFDSLKMYIPKGQHFSHEKICILIFVLNEIDERKV